MVVLMSGESVATIQPLRGCPRPGPSPITHTSNESYLASLIPKGRPPSLRGHGLYPLELRDQVEEPTVGIGGQSGVEKAVRPSYLLDRHRGTGPLGTVPAVLNGLCPVKLLVNLVCLQAWHSLAHSPGLGMKAGLSLGKGAL